MFRSGHHIKCHEKSWFKLFKSFSATPAPNPMTTYLGCQYFKRCHEEQHHQYPSLFPYFTTIVCPPLYGWVPPLPSFFCSTISLTWLFWTFHNLFWFFIHFSLSRRMGRSISEKGNWSLRHTRVSYLGAWTVPWALWMRPQQYSSALTAYSESQFALQWMNKSPSQSPVFNTLLKLKKIEKVNLLYSEFIIISK